MKTHKPYIGDTNGAWEYDRLKKLFNPLSTTYSYNLPSVASITSGTNWATKKGAYQNARRQVVTFDFDFDSKIVVHRSVLNGRFYWIIYITRKP